MKAFVVLAHCLSMDQQLRILPLWQGVLLSPCFNCSCVVLIIAHSSPIGEHIFNPIGHQVLILLLSPMGSWNRFKLVTYLFPLFGFCFYGGGACSHYEAQVWFNISIPLALFLHTESTDEQCQVFLHCHSLNRALYRSESFNFTSVNPPKVHKCNG